MLEICLAFLNFDRLTFSCDVKVGSGNKYKYLGCSYSLSFAMQKIIQHKIGKLEGITLVYI